MQFSRLPDNRLEEAFDVFQCVGRWIESQGRKQRITKTTFADYHKWQREKANYMVTLNDQITGLVTLRHEVLESWPDFDQRPVLMLRGLATHPDYRGQGIGSFAVQESIKLCSAGESLYLDCVSDFLPNYYANLGFAPVMRQVRTYEDGETYDITLMQHSPGP